MAANIDRYKADLDKLVDLGADLQTSMQFDVHPDAVKKHFTGLGWSKAKIDAWINDLIPFNSNYERWYSQSLALIRQILPDRLLDFISLYERPKARKDITFVSYTMRDFLERITVPARSLGPSAALGKFDQQCSILAACKDRFASSLFEIKQLAQADLFDSELDASRELLRHGFGRAAGAICGVLIEKHLQQVCADHKISITKKHPGINDFADALKGGGVLSIQQFRNIQYLADVRNLCDHSKDRDPTKEEIGKLLDGTNEVLKTIA